MSKLYNAGRVAPARTLSVHSPAIAIVEGIAVLEPVRLSGRAGVNSLLECELALTTTAAVIGATRASIQSPYRRASWHSSPARAHMPLIDKTEFRHQ